MPGAIAAYQTVQTSTADPAQLILLLFDGAMRFLREALKAVDHGDTAAFARAQQRAHAIVGELSASLNHEIGGEVAANLDRLYGFMLQHLAEGLLHRRRENLETVLGLLRTVREAFEGAIDTQARERRGKS